MPKTHDQTPSLVSQHVTTYELQLPWPKVLGNHAVKHTRAGGHYKVPAAQAYDALVAQILAGMGMGCLSRQKPLAGPLKLSWLFCPPDRRARDLDNVRKVVADSLTKAEFWIDDSNKVLVHESFEWSSPQPGGVIGLCVEVFS